MKLHVAISDREANVEIRREGERVFARVDEIDYQLIAHERGNGSYLLINQGQVFDCRVEGNFGSGELLEAIVGPDQFALTLTDPKRLRGFGDAAAHADAAARIVAPMPGKVVRVLVEAGAHVEAGAGIIVVEAMKMQNEMKSPKSGTVAAVNVEVGATVNGGDVLAVIE